MYNRQEYESKLSDYLYDKIKDLSREEAFSAYEAAILGESETLTDNSLKELSLEIQRQLDEMKVSVNSIINTIVETFPTREELVKDFNLLYKKYNIDQDVVLSLKDNFIKGNYHQSTLVISKDNEVIDNIDIDIDFSEEDDKVFGILSNIIDTIEKYKNKGNNIKWVL